MSPQTDEDKMIWAETFKSSATNEDGLLNQAMYMDFIKKLNGNQMAKHGEAVTWTEDEINQMYEGTNKLTPDVDGVSAADF